MAKVVIAEFMDSASVEALRAAFDVHYDPELVERPADLTAHAADATALVVRNRTQVRGDLLTACKSLKVIGRLGVGLDNIDLETCRDRGIQVCPARGANEEPVAEYVIAVLLLLIRGSFQATPDVVAGSWPRTASIGKEVAGKRLGLIGLGAIGRQVARRAQALSMEIVAYDPFVDPEDAAWQLAASVGLEELLGTCDAISLHLPYSAETHHFLSAERLAAIRPGAILINTARGGVLDSDALVAALKSGQLSGAALDVHEEETARRPGRRQVCRSEEPDPDPAYCRCHQGIEPAGRGGDGREPDAYLETGGLKGSRTFF